MGEKANPWCNWPNPPWKFNIDSSACNPYPPDVGLDNTNSVTLPTCLNSDAYIYSGVAAPVPFFTASVTDRPLPMSTRFVTALAPSVGLSAADPPQKRSLVIHQNENHTTPLACPFLSKGALDTVPELQGSNETNVTAVGTQDTGDTHENTEEIDALLDSDSDEEYEKAQEFKKARKSPVENDTESVASAGASAGAARLAKKRRLSSGTDRSVVDTASSARPDHSIGQKRLANNDDAQSCCFGEVESDHKFALTLREGEEAEGDSPDDRKRRRERIQETVASLRKIVPGGIAKDATAVLDEAICYLKYLKLKVKTLGAVSL